MVGSDGSGRIALLASAAALPGVSEPSRVVRSVVRIASSSAQSFASFLMLRFARLAARSSSATASIAPMRGRRGSSGSSNPAGRTGAWAMQTRLGAPPLLLVSIPVVADEEIGKGHSNRVMLHLPDVAELVRDQAVVGEQLARAEQDRPVRGVAVEAPEPRQPEEPRRDPDPHAAQRHGPRVQLAMPGEPLLRTHERVELRGIHGPSYSVAAPVKRRLVRILQ